MPILFVGNSLQDFDASGTVYYETPANEPAVSSGGAALENIQTGGRLDAIFCNIGTARDEVYITERVTNSAPASTFTVRPMRLAIGAQEILRMEGKSGSYLRCYLWNGTSFVAPVPNIDTAAIPAGVNRFDWYFKLHSSTGRVRLKINGIIYLDYTGPLMPSGGLFDRIALGAWNNGGTGPRHTEIIVSTENTEGLRVVTLNLLSDGALSDWDGTVSDINWLSTSTFTDGPTAPDSTFITTTTPEQTSTFIPKDIPTAFGDSIIQAVVVAGRGNAGGGVNGVSGVARIGGVDYEQPSTATLPVLKGPFQAIYESNPATSGFWLPGDVNAAEFGYRSKA